MKIKEKFYAIQNKGFSWHSNDTKHQTYELALQEFAGLPHYLKKYYKIVVIEQVTTIKTHHAWV